MKQTVSAKMYLKLSEKIRITNVYQHDDRLIAISKIVPSGINDTSMSESCFTVSVNTHNKDHELPVTHWVIGWNAQSINQIVQSGELQNAVELPFIPSHSNGYQKIGFWQKEKDSDLGPVKYDRARNMAYHGKSLDEIPLGKNHEPPTPDSENEDGVCFKL